MNELDDRSLLLVQELQAAPGIKMKTLEEKMKLSRSQITYSLQKINEWMDEKKLPRIENNRRSGFYIDERVASMLKVTSLNKSHVPSEMERPYLISLMLLCRTEEISLFHLANALRISRNTVLNDLKRTDSLVEKYRLSIYYNRREGYAISGSEFTKRKLLIETVHQLLKSPQGHQLVQDFGQLPKQEIEAFKRRFEKVEKRLNVTFTDEKMNELPYILLVLLKRMGRGKCIPPFDIHFSDLSNTMEYKVVEDLLWNMGSIDENDRLFITLKLLSTNVSQTELNEIRYKELLEAIDNMLLVFEIHACLTLQDKELLREQIYQHLKPAMYRILYGLTTENPLLQEIQREHMDVHHLLKKCVKSIEVVIKKEIPEDEIGYLTLLIKSWLHKYGNNLAAKQKAIVVCPNGVSVSKLLFETLRGMFPEIILLDHISIREFAKYPVDYDVVFSTVALTTTKKLFIIHPFLSQKEKLQLQTRVSRELYGYSPTQIDYDAVLAIIDKYTIMKDKQRLTKELVNYFERTKENNPTTTQKGMPTLEELLHMECIQLMEEAADWKEAIRIAARPLVHSNKVTNEYVECIIDKHNPEEPYMVIAPMVAIPHAAPEDGVLELSMSLLCLKREVEFAPSLPVQLVFIIAAIDRKQHLKGLLQLSELVSNEVYVKKMINATNQMEVMRYIHEISDMVVET